LPITSFGLYSCSRSRAKSSIGGCVAYVASTSAAAATACSNVSATTTAIGCRL